MMRPAFLTSPGAWIRTPRVSETPAEHACAVHRVTVCKHGARADRVIYAVVFIVLAGWALAAHLGVTL
jgi:hypothetical protein